jgi:hypothetical protein
VLEIMGRDVGPGLDPDCFAALRRVLDTVPDQVVDVPAAKVVEALSEDYTQAA